MGHSPWGCKASHTAEHITVLFGGGFPGGLDSKESTCSAEVLGSIPRSGRPPGEGNGTPLHSSCLENSTARGTWQATVHGVAELDMTEQHTQRREKEEIKLVYPFF